VALYLDRILTALGISGHEPLGGLDAITDGVAAAQIVDIQPVSRFAIHAGDSNKNLLVFMKSQRKTPGSQCTPPRTWLAAWLGSLIAIRANDEVLGRRPRLECFHACRRYRCGECELAGIEFGMKGIGKRSARLDAFTDQN
jgi:hypothetical protein